VKRAELDGLTFHGLRRTAAGLLIEAGAHIETIEQRLGHPSGSGASNLTPPISVAEHLNELDAALSQHPVAVVVVSSDGTEAQLPSWQ